MPDQLPLNPDPNAAPAAPASTAPPAAPPAPAAAAPVKPAKKGGQLAPQPGRKKGIIEIPEYEFMRRVRGELSAELRRRTGMSLDEAERLIKTAGTKQPGNGKSTETAVITQLRTDIDKLRKANERLAREGGQTTKKLEKRLRSANDARVEAELRADARLAGITDPDYAVSLFARAVTKDTTLQPETFFASLKETHPILFAAPVQAAPAPKVVVAPTTTPPESPATGEVRPKPAAAGAPPREQNAEHDSPQEFAARQRSYGYVPGM